MPAVDIVRRAHLGRSFLSARTDVNEKRVTLRCESAMEPDLQTSEVHIHIALMNRLSAMRQPHCTIGEGHSITGILDGLKKDFALQYIKQRDLNLVQVAFLLGYVDHSNG